MAVLVALALTGAIGAWIGGGSKTKAAVRVVIGGAAALIATFADRQLARRQRHHRLTIRAPARGRIRRGTYAGSDEPAADVPIPPDLSRRYGGTLNRPRLARALPRLIGHCLDQWRPRAGPRARRPAVERPRSHRGPGAAPSNTGPPEPAVRQRRPEAAVLKIAFPHEEALVEPQALALWSGHGAVRLLAHDAGAGALLLERLDAARSLQDVPVGRGGAGVGRTGPPAQPGPGRPAGVAGISTTWRPGPSSGAMSSRRAWEQLGRPFPRWLLEAALEVCQTRGAVGRRSGKDVLVHADLHYLNILARPGVAGAGNAGRTGGAGYAAIDPQPMIGEAEFAVAPVLWNRIRELPAAGSRTGAARALPRLQRGRRSGRRGRPAVEPGARGGERPLVRLASPVTKAIWPVRSGWPSTLAGRTLPGPARPARLPAPGERRRRQRTPTGPASPADGRQRRRGRRRRRLPTSASSVLQLLTEIRRISRSCQREPDIQTRPSADDPLRHGAGHGVVAEGQGHLGVVDVVEHLDAVQRGQLFRQLRGPAARACGPGRRRRRGPAISAPPIPARRGPGGRVPAPSRTGRRRRPRPGSGSWCAAPSPTRSARASRTTTIPQS